MNREFKVVIIGGGLVGSLEALLLGNRGFTVEVYERRRDIRREAHYSGRSINLALSTRGIEGLKKAGIADEILEKCIPMKGRYIHALNGSHSKQPYDIYGNCINSVDRKMINETLLIAAEQCAFVKVNFEHSVGECDFENGTVSVIKYYRLTSERTKEKRTIEGVHLIIGADGAYSKVRGQLMRHTRVNYSQNFIDHAYVELCMPPNDDGDYAMDGSHLHIWPRQTFMMIALPNLDKSFTVTLFMPWSKFNEIKDPNALMKFFKSTFPDAVKLIGEERLIEDYFKNEKGSLVTVKCNPYNHHKGLLLGDAAHAMVPFYGQGMNCGFEDCLILDELLDRAVGSGMPTDVQLENILKEYTRIRNPDAEAICDLALHNYIEMRSGVQDPVYLFRKKIEGTLYRFFPKQFMPLYSMVSFSRTRYSVAKALYHKRTPYFVILRYAYKFGLAALLFAVFKVAQRRLLQ